MKTEALTEQLPQVGLASRQAAIQRPPCPSPYSFSAFQPSLGPKGHPHQEGGAEHGTPVRPAQSHHRAGHWRKGGSGLVGGLHKYKHIISSSTSTARSIHQPTTSHKIGFWCLPKLPFFCMSKDLSAKNYISIKLQFLQMNLKFIP